MSWLRGVIDSLRVRYSPSHPGGSHDLPGNLVVSLTSHPPRFRTLDLTLRCLLNQSIQPNVIVLWLTAEDKEKLPKRVIRLLSDKLIVRTIERDLGPFKKIIPSLIHYREHFIVTADDDVSYGKDWLRTLLSAYTKPSEIVCLRSRRVKCQNGTISSYSEWNRAIGAGSDIMPVGFGGVLYPPGALSSEATDEATFMQLCPKADDIWLYWMAIRAGATFRCVESSESLRSWHGSKSSSLFHFNTVQGGNDKQIAAMVERFGLPSVLLGNIFSD